MWNDDSGEKKLPDDDDEQMSIKINPRERKKKDRAMRSIASSSPILSFFIHHRHHANISFRSQQI